MAASHRRLPWRGRCWDGRQDRGPPHQDPRPEESLSVLSIMTINIGAASPDRARMLLDWLARRPEDVFILTETSAGPGTAYLLDQFRRAGYAVIKTPDGGGERGSALISRVQICRDLTPEIASVSIPCRVSAGVLDSEPQIAVLGMYVPSRDRSEAKTERKRQ